MVRRQAFQQVGLFDESFGKYFEDVDICLRMARAGWRVMYHGGTSCYHIEQRASRRLLSRDAWRHARAISTGSENGAGGDCPNSRPPLPLDRPKMGLSP